MPQRTAPRANPLGVQCAHDRLYERPAVEGSDSREDLRSCGHVP